jgi:hypothetical protein
VPPGVDGLRLRRDGVETVVAAEATEDVAVVVLVALALPETVGVAQLPELGRRDLRPFLDADLAGRGQARLTGNFEAEAMPIGSWNARCSNALG